MVQHIPRQRRPGAQQPILQSQLPGVGILPGGQFKQRLSRSDVGALAGSRQLFDRQDQICAHVQRRRRSQMVEAQQRFQRHLVAAAEAVQRLAIADAQRIDFTVPSLHPWDDQLSAQVEGIGVGKLVGVLQRLGRNAKASGNRPQRIAGFDDVIRRLRLCFLRSKLSDILRQDGIDSACQQNAHRQQREEAEDDFHKGRVSVYIHLSAKNFYLLTVGNDFTTKITHDPTNKL